MYVCTRLGDTALPRKPRSAEPQRDSACKYRSRVGVSFVGFFAQLFRTPVNSSATTSVDLTECTDHSAAAPAAPRRAAPYADFPISLARKFLGWSKNSGRRKFHRVSSISLAVLGIILLERHHLTHRRRYHVSRKVRKSC